MINLLKIKKYISYTVILVLFKNITMYLFSYERSLILIF